jgi:hypothetical protein
MRKIREILRLRWENHLPQRAIAQSRLLLNLRGSSSNCVFAELLE